MLSLSFQGNNCSIYMTLLPHHVTEGEGALTVPGPDLPDFPSVWDLSAADDLHPEGDHRDTPRRSPTRRSPLRRGKRSWSSSSSCSDDERDARSDRYTYGPFTRRIRDNSIPRGLEKPPHMDSYDGTLDPDEHIENIEAVLTYCSVRGVVKCKLFVTTLRRGAMTWFKNLQRNSIFSPIHLSSLRTPWVDRNYVNSG